MIDYSLSPRPRMQISFFKIYFRVRSSRDSVCFHRCANAWMQTVKSLGFSTKNKEIDKSIQLSSNRISTDRSMNRRWISMVQTRVFLYNCGTWALSSSLADRIDRAQRKMLRKVMGLTWKHKVTHDHLYAKFNTSLPHRSSSENRIPATDFRDSLIS